jgi:hypothetical protein
MKVNIHLDVPSGSLLADEIMAKATEENSTCYKTGNNPWMIAFTVMDVAHTLKIVRALLPETEEENDG